MVENEARKILDAGQPKSVESTKPVDHGGLGFVQVSKLDLTLGSNSHEPPDPLIVTPCKRALEVYGSKVKAARALGIAETTFRDRLKKELASGPA